MPSYYLQCVKAEMYLDVVFCVFHVALVKVQVTVYMVAKVMLNHLLFEMPVFKIYYTAYIFSYNL